jgi:hypothetical protein
MHVIFQFPIIDYRSLLPGKGGRLPFPEWPEPSDAHAFIRRFGNVAKRFAGGNKDFPGESYYCNAHLSMRFDDLHKKGPVLEEGLSAAIINCYRRFFSDGKFVCKMEAGFVDNTEKRSARIKEKPVDISTLLMQYADLPVMINNKQRKLYTAGKFLADQYYLESTKKPAGDKPMKPVKEGELCVVTTFSSVDNLQLPKHSFLLKQIELSANRGNLKIHGYKLRKSDQAIKVWLIETPVWKEGPPNDVKALIRELRMYLLRVHLEKETMRILLNGIKSGDIPLEQNSAQAKEVDDYFQDIGEKIFQKKRFSFNQADLLGFALQSEEVVNPGSFSTIEDGIHYFKDKYTRQNIEKAITGMARKIVLFICACPTDKNPLAFLKEFSRIKKALRQSLDRNNFDLEIEGSVKNADLFELLNDYRPEYLHISLHSSLKNGLYFEDEAGNLSTMPVEEFKSIMNLFAQVHKPAAIILSACNSKNHGLAIKDIFDHVIATETVLPETAGIVYASRFYTTLFSNNSNTVPFCHAAACQAIEFTKPSFAPINEFPVHQILTLL